jgi:hypothetical protein
MSGAAGLADHAPVDLFAARFEGFDDATCAVDDGPFLVARQQECQRAGVLRVRRNEALGSSDHRGEPALHVRGAASIQGCRRERPARTDRSAIPRAGPVGTTSV